MKKSALGVAAEARQPLVYKDAPDGDSGSDENDEAMAEALNGDSSGDEDDDDMDEGASSEEEIKEIPLKRLAEKSLKRKRARTQGLEDDEESDSSENDQDLYETPMDKKAVSAAAR